MMSRIASGVRGGSPSCAMAPVAAATIWPVESIRVPSQSNTTSRVFLSMPPGDTLSTGACAAPRRAAIPDISGMVLVQPRNHLRELPRQRRGIEAPLAAFRVFPADGGGVQEEPVQAEPFHAAVVVAITVAIVAGQWMTGLGRLHADLVRAAGHDADFQQGRRRADLDRPEDAGRGLAAVIHRDHALATPHALAQAVLEPHLAEFPAPFHQRQVALLHPALAQQLVQR